VTKALDSRTIFITGSGGVLGTTYVRNMLRAGARVVATDLVGARADALQDSFGENHNFAFYDLDVSDEDQVKEIFKRVAADGHQPNVKRSSAAIRVRPEIKTIIM
jgi:NAD(P)-dependent dehydrogenase (short-subunit alcohol dehydrogenase family)